jgi:cytochrome c oxidase assembly factor CtaG
VHVLSDFDALLALLVVAAALLYACGVARVWRKAGVGRGIRVADAVRFTLGIAAVALALLSPLDALAAQSFALHMIEHETLMVIAAPLLVLARPLEAWLWAFPRQDVRRAAATAARMPTVVRVWRAMTLPVGATCVHALALWIWHAPALFAAALDSLPLHVLQHACFFASALAFWWAVFGGAARAPRPVSLACLFTTMLHTSALGAVLTFAPTAWYMHGAAHGSGLSPLEDQQLGGLVMWIPGGVAYVVGALAVARTWLARPRALAFERMHRASGAARDESDWSGHRATHVGPPRDGVRAQRAC